MDTETIIALLFIAMAVGMGFAEGISEMVEDHRMNKHYKSAADLLS